MNDMGAAIWHTVNIEEALPNFIRDWREYRGMTGDALARAVGTTKGQISMLETGERQLTQGWMVRIARILGCRPGDLMDNHPHDVPAEIRYKWLKATKEQRDQISQLADVVLGYRVGPPVSSQP